MITLTNAKLVNSVLGGTDTVSYDRFVLSSITYTPETMVVSAIIQITSTAQPNMQPIKGSLSIKCATAILSIEVRQLDFYRQIALTGPENAVAQDFIRDAQNSLENGLISLGVVAGIQSPGA